MANTQQNGFRQQANGHRAGPAAQRIQDDISGSYTDPQAVADVLRRASDGYNLVGPMAFGALPEGFAVVMSVVKIDAGEETYDVGFGKRGLSRIAVERIAGAAGVSTQASQCIGMAANFCAWSVTVARQDLDGSVRSQTKSRSMDLREGSGQLEAMRAQARAKKKDPENQIREQRLHIAAHAETKAWLRAVRTLLGLRTYTMEELGKPFAVPKLQFTGRSADPKLRFMFAQGLMNAALGGIAALYGGPATASSAMLSAGPAPLQLGTGHVVGADLDDPDADDEPYEPPLPDRGSGSAPPVAPGDPTKLRLPQKGGGGPTLREVDDGRLRRAEVWIAQRLDEGKVPDRYLAEEQVLLATIRVELAERARRAAGPGTIPDDIDQPYPDDAPEPGGRDPNDPDAY
jgi:hypothetical protein